MFHYRCSCLLALLFLNVPVAIVAATPAYTTITNNHLLIPCEWYQHAIIPNHDKTTPPEDLLRPRECYPEAATPNPDAATPDTKTSKNSKGLLIIPLLPPSAVIPNQGAATAATTAAPPGTGAIPTAPGAATPVTNNTATGLQSHKLYGGATLGSSNDSQNTSQIASASRSANTAGSAVKNNHTLIAGTKTHKTSNKKSALYQWYLGATLGFSHLSATGQNTLQIAPAGMPADTFSTNGGGKGRLYGIEGGITFPRLPAHWFPAWSVGVSLWQSAGLDTKITRTFAYNTPPDVFNAQIPIRISSLFFNTSVDIYQWRGFAPFVKVGVGSAKVTADGFTETNANPNNQSEPWTFAPNSTTKFLYDIALGLRYQITSHWQIQLEYSYLPLGTITTGTGNTGVVSAPGLSQKITTNNVLLRVNYLF